MIWLKNLLFSVLVPGTVALLVPHWILTATGVWGRPLAAWQLPGLLVLAAGLAIYLRCVVDFGSAGGTPAPIDPPRELVVRHLYRFSRNPMYVGVLSVILGQAWLFASAWLALYGALVFGMFNSFIVLYEEPALTRQFGPAYERYRSRVPRWIGRVAR